jgi:hypothetical protein
MQLGAQGRLTEERFWHSAWSAATAVVLRPVEALEQRERLAQQCLRLVVLARAVEDRGQGRAVGGKVWVVGARYRCQQEGDRLALPTAPLRFRSR